LSIGHIENSDDEVKKDENSNFKNTDVLDILTEFDSTQTHFKSDAHFEVNALGDKHGNFALTKKPESDSRPENSVKTSASGDLITSLFSPLDSELDESLDIAVEMDISLNQSLDINDILATNDLPSPIVKLKDDQSNSDDKPGQYDKHRTMFGHSGISRPSIFRGDIFKPFKASFQDISRHRSFGSGRNGRLRRITRSCTTSLVDHNYSRPQTEVKFTVKALHRKHVIFASTPKLTKIKNVNKFCEVHVFLFACYRC